MLTVGLVLTLIAGFGVDYVDIAFGNRIGRALRQTESTRRAFVGYFHRHMFCPPKSCYFGCLKPQVCHEIYRQIR